MRARLDIRIACLVSGLLAAPVDTLAHHAFAAEFDRDQPVEVTGTVTNVEWMNPHARFYVDVEDENGVVVNWDFELGSPNGLMRRGWTRNSMQIGDVVTIDGILARDGSPSLNAQSVLLDKTGQRLFARSASEDSEAGDAKQD